MKNFIQYMLIIVQLKMKQNISIFYLNLNGLK